MVAKRSQKMRVLFVIALTLSSALADFQSVNGDTVNSFVDTKATARDGLDSYGAPSADPISTSWDTGSSYSGSFSAPAAPGKFFILIYSISVK